MLALSGRMGASILSHWLLKHGVPIWEANEWNELTHILQGLFKPISHKQNLTFGHAKPDSITVEIDMSVLVLVIDIGMLNLSTDIWKEQLNYLDTINRKVKFAWILNHDTSNTIKIELRRRGHLLMVNGPLYKAKMIQVIEAVIKEKNLEQMNKITMASNPHKCVQLDPMNSDTKSTNDSEISEIISTSGSQIEETNQENFPLDGAVSNCTPELNEVPSEPNKISTNDNSNCEQGIHQTEKTKNEQKDLEGLRVLLAEDNPILQRVATIMLERMGAKVVVVGDGAQAVEALNIQHKPLYDLILMDCQVQMSLLTFLSFKAFCRKYHSTSSFIPYNSLYFFVYISVINS